MNNLILLLTFFVNTTYASELVFYKENKKFLFNYAIERQLIISKDCKNCQAEQALKKVKKVELKSGGANPGALICENQLKAEIVILNDFEKNQNSFCLFKDKSMIGLSSLTYQSMN